MRSARLLFVAASIAAGGAETASAHALPKMEDPPAGTAVAKPPTRIAITFSEAVDLHFSGIIVRNAQGQRVDRGDDKPDPHDAARLSVGLKHDLAAGTYSVTWHALDTDGHRTQGNYSFSVAP